MAKGVSVIIPNYNGKDLLEKNLPFVLQAIRAGDEVIVVDDASSDNSVQFIKDTYPQVNLIPLDENQGFVASCNCGVKNSRNDLVYLLNNDVEVSKNFLEPLVGYFSDRAIFAVNSAEIPTAETDYNFNTLLKLRFKFGFLTYRYQSIKRLGQVVAVPFAHGGHALFDKKKFIQLGMFDQLFRPFNHEDWDISYRAWKCGWQVLLEPNSLVYHQPGSTIARMLSPSGYERINWKNHFLFIWKDIVSLRLTIAHLLCLPFLLILAPFFGQGQFTLGFLLALKQLPEVIKRRRLAKKENYIFSDRHILKRFSR